MIRADFAHPLCAILSILLAAPAGFAQAPAVPATPATQLPPKPAAAGLPLTITILAGNNSINSIPLLRSTAAIVEVRDSNDFPVEDATVTFTLPAQGPGGTFAQGGKTFSTRTDVRGQAMAPVVVPVGPGKFQIAVTAVSGDRKGDVVVNQTNSEGTYVGQPLPPPSWYKKKLFWAVAGGAAAAVVLAIILTHHSKTSTNTVVVTPGAPVFQ